MSDIKEGTVLTIDSSPTLTQEQYLLSLKELGTLSRCVLLLVEYKIAGKISSKEAPVDVVELAKSLELNENNLRRILSFLASHGILKEHEGGRFGGTPISDLLRDDNEKSVAEMMRYCGRREVQLALVDMGVSLKSGESSSFQHVTGAPFYSYLGSHPDMERSFELAMSSYSTKVREELVQHLDFSRFSMVADIAGGRGALLEKILREHKKIQGTLFERPSVIKLAVEELNLPPFKDRFHAVAGDIFDEIHLEADLFVVTNLLSNFNDDDAGRIIGNIKKAMARSAKQQEGSCLLIVEPEMSNLPPNEPAILKRGLDLMMMLMAGGRIRSVDEWSKFLLKCSLQVVNSFKLLPIHHAYECRLA